MTEEDRYPGLRIFISHSHHNNELGYRLADDLHYFLGSDKYIWYDSRGGILGGEAWWPTIQKALTRCTKFIVLLSKEALTSREKWVDEEINMAYPRYRSKRLDIIPLRCDDYQFRGRPRIRTLQTIPCRNSEEYQHAFQHIIKALKLSDNVIDDFLQREIKHIEIAFRSRNMDAVLQGSLFLISYFPTAVTSGLYWRRAIAFLDKGKWQEANRTLRIGLEQVTDREQYMNWVDTYLNILIKEELVTEAIALTTELLRWTTYSAHITVRQKQLQQYETQKMKTTQSMTESTALVFPSLSSNQPTSEQTITQSFDNQHSGHDSLPVRSSLSSQSSSDLFSSRVEEVMTPAHRAYDDEEYDSTPEAIPSSTSTQSPLQDLSSLPWWDRFNLFIEQKMHHSHPKNLFGSASFIGAGFCNLIFLTIFASSLPIFPLIGSAAVFPLAIAFVGGRWLPIKAIGFLFALFLAAFWAISGYLLTRNIAVFSTFSIISQNLISIVEWTVFIITGLWGFFWHWELFKQGK